MEKELRNYIIKRIEDLSNSNLLAIGYYMPSEIDPRLNELKRLAEHFGIDIGPAHSFNNLVVNVFGKKGY